MLLQQKTEQTDKRTKYHKTENTRVPFIVSPLHLKRREKQRRLQQHQRPVKQLLINKSKI